MKKFFLILIGAMCTFTLSAQTCVSVKQISADYKTDQIKIAITRTGCTGDASNLRNTVWVFVDYRDVGGSSWTRAAISVASPGTFATDNDKGVWIYGANSPTAQTVTLTLKNMPTNKYDWCAFATDYPPNATLLGPSGSTYTLKGTPPFTIDGSYTTSARTYIGSITSITDATRNPEGFVNIPGCSITTFNLGTVSFVSSQTWSVSGTGANSHIKQIWSTPVMATNCNKTTYAGNTVAPFSYDCRKHSQDSYGHLFSWCMIKRYATQLCPSPWRVPTPTDMCNTDKALNSRANCTNRTDQAACARWKSSSWGSSPNIVLVYRDNRLSEAVTAPYVYTDGWVVNDPPSRAHGAWFQGYTAAGNYGNYRVYPNTDVQLGFGTAVRCVRDAQ